MQRPGDRAADAAGSAGDESALARQIEHVARPTPVTITNLPVFGRK
jgi:hypothetical protein